MKIISIVGTRPQFLKMIPLSMEFEKHSNIESIIIHSGQHYDSNMSADIFTSLNVKQPDYILKREGDTLIQNLTNMMIGIENVVLKEKPNIIIVFGDCDTTTAGALVANKNNIFLIHIEAGMRSYNRKMPEEINRLITDNISDLLLCSTPDSLSKLKNENINTNAFYVGNLQIDLLDIISKKNHNPIFLQQINVQKNNYVLMTIHRAYNTNKTSLHKIFSQLKLLKFKIIFPIHPRTKNVIEKENISIPENIQLIEPVNYINMCVLQKFSKFIITDSGGIQPEAYFLKKKCIVLRSETEWIEPIKNKNNILFDYKTPLNKFIEDFLKVKVIKDYTKINASENIVNIINNLNL
jgi:UDP-GlcNAc3NAcA epimerase